MNDIKPAMKLIGGVEPTPQQVQRVQAIAHSLGIASNDPMLPILIALDAYHGAFPVSLQKLRRRPMWRQQVQRNKARRR